MNSLYARIEAAILSRQERAQAATGGLWRAFGTYVATEVNACTCAGGFEWVPHEPHCGYEPIHGGGLAEHDATFIAAEDPAFVLRQCERDLKTLERHLPTASTISPDYHTFCDDTCTGIRCQCCSRDAPCPDIQDLADAYSVPFREVS